MVWIFFLRNIWQPWFDWVCAAHLAHSENTSPLGMINSQNATLN